MPDQALADVRVLEVGHSISAPYCTKLLAGYGAEVIKVEDSLGGDPTRRTGPFPDDIPSDETSGLFLHLNANKKGITLNLRSATGAKLLKELVQQADILVENYPPSFLPSLGLPYDVLAELNPRLVMTSITPFGQTGPYRDYRATDLVIFAMSGRMNIHGQPDREPLRYAPEIGWFQTGATAAMATLGALFTSRLQGISQWVDVSAMEALAGNVDNRLLAYAYSGEKAQRGGLGLAYPSSTYPCADGYMLFAAGGDRFFRRLCRAMGMVEMLQDPRWATMEARQAHREEFEELLLPWLLERSRREVFEILQAGGVMCAPLLSMDELYQDPQLLARGYFAEVEHPRAGRLTMPGAPYKMTETPWQLKRPAPLLGEHNQEVYCGSLGYEKVELAGFKAMGAI